MFEYLRNEDGTNVPVCKEVKTTAASYEVGDALVFDASTGLLKVCTGTTKPQYISAAKKTVTAEDSLLPVYPVFAGQEYKTQFSDDASAVKVGSAVTIDATGKKVTATTTSGVFTIIEKLGSGAAGTEVIGKFM